MDFDIVEDYGVQRELKLEIINTTVSELIKSAKYINVHFIDVKFTNTVLISSSMLHCKFTNCTFNHFIVRNSNVFNCTFDKCTFENVELTSMFLYCLFVKVDFKKCLTLKSQLTISLNTHYNINIDKEYNSLACDNIIAENSFFSDVDFTSNNLNYSIFRNCQMLYVKINESCGLKGAKIINPIYNFDLVLKSTTTIIVDKDTVFPNIQDIRKVLRNDSAESIKIRKKYADRLQLIFKYLNDNKFDRLENLYLTISIGYEASKCFQKASETNYISKRIRHKTLSGKGKIGSNISNIICGHGEKWHRSIGVAVFLVVGFAIPYMTGLRVTEGYYIAYNYFDFEWVSFSTLLNYDILSVIKDFGNCLYFSMMTFTTVGYGNMETIGLISKVASFFEMFFGVLFIGAIAGSLFKRFSR